MNASYIIIGAWAAFLLVWLISAFRAKRTLRRLWWRGTILRVAALAVLLALLQAKAIRVPPLWTLAANPWIAAAGAVLTVVGVAFAIWARLHIGSNWGMPMSVKENPELVTSGPYAYVRHPIYTGMIFALLGSGLVSPWWLLVWAVSVAYFVYSAKKEEQLLVATFPEAYPPYMARTKMLVPFVF